MTEKSANRETEKSGLAAHALLVVWVAVLATSTSAIFVRYSTAPSLVLAAYRKTFVTLMLAFPVLMNAEYRREMRGLSRSTVLWCLASGSFLAVHFWTYFLSVHNTSIAASQVLVNTEVLFVAFFLFVTGKEKPDGLGGIGIAVALAGAVVVAYTRSGMAGTSMSGNLQAAFAAGMLACYSLIGTKVRVNCSNTVYTFLVYGTSAVVLNLLIPVSGYSFFGYGRINWFMALGMAVCNSLMGHSLFNWSLKYLNPTIVSICKLFQPVFTIIWGIILFREYPVWHQLAGGVVVMLGIYLYIRSKGRKARQGGSYA